MIVIGGTYVETCLEPNWENIYGSGLRAVDYLLQNKFNEPITFYTCSDERETKEHLDFYRNLYKNLTIHTKEIEKSPEFHYDYPLKTPTIIPRPDIFKPNNTKINVTGNNILLFGLIEASFEISGEVVVYDPQSPVNPITFSKTNSTAKRLHLIINLSEAKTITKLEKIDDIQKSLFRTENCESLIIKMGAKGAVLYESPDSEPYKIPVYKTDKVWPIGSGDVFSSAFALNLFKGMDIRSCAVEASKSTALYCSSKDLAVNEKKSSFSFSELIIDKIPTGQIYLAGPFFNFTQRWLVSEIRRTFLGFGLNVFSPFHDVGHGKAKDVVHKDIEGIASSKVMFAIVDGLDSGTIFEIGYAICKKIPVIVYVQNETEESLKMLEGTGCVIESDLTTAIYKLYWILGEE